MTRAEPQVNFRMPAELKILLEEVAGKNKRSITAELVARLESTFHESPAKHRRSIGVPDIGSKDANEMESQETLRGKALAARRCIEKSKQDPEESLQRQRQLEELQQAMTQVLTPLMEKIREDIHFYLEQADQRMADITVKYRQVTDEQNPAHPTASASIAPNIDTHSPQKKRPRY